MSHTDVALPANERFEDAVPGRYWEAVDDNRVQCNVCPRACRMRDGQRGLCFVRGAQDGEVVLTTWGRSSGFCVDPIEKKPLNHFLPGTPVLSFGTAGCNLTCKFCQNWDISKARQFDRLNSLATPEMIAEAARRTGCRSVAFTYNDPVIFLEYAVDVAKACHAIGIRTVAVTAGYITPEARGEFFRHMDATNIDLKAFTAQFYRSLTTSSLDAVLDTIRFVRRETDVWMELTNLVIPGENDSDDEFARMCDWILEELGVDVPVHFSAFHPDYKMMDKPRTPQATLVRARSIAKARGLRYVYVGNVHDSANESTWCHGCGALLIERHWYDLGHWGLTHDGRCRQCGTACAGVFDGPPGTWGRRRLPLRLQAA